MHRAATGVLLTGSRLHEIVSAGSAWTASALSLDIETAHAAASSCGADSYTDPRSGAHVFTAAALARRGVCCGSGCRHCPFGHWRVATGRPRQPLRAAALLRAAAAAAAPAPAYRAALLFTGSEQACGDAVSGSGSGGGGGGGGAQLPLLLVAAFDAATGRMLAAPGCAPVQPPPHLGGAFDAALALGVDILALPLPSVLPLDELCAAIAAVLGRRVAAPAGAREAPLAAGDGEALRLIVADAAPA